MGGSALLGLLGKMKPSRQGIKIPPYPIAERLFWLSVTQ